MTARRWRFVGSMTATLSVMLTLSGCGSSSASTSGGGGELIASGKSRDLSPVVPASDSTALAAGNAAFSAALYARQARGTNLFYSPHSISSALAMVYAGARGNTATQMAAALHYGLPAARLHPAFNQLDLTLQARAQPVAPATQGFKLSIANATWGQQGYPFQADFLDTLAVNYGAGLHALDFIAAPEPSRQTINTWVAQQTAQRIKDLVPQGAISSATRLVLTNAIYFLAPWATPFETAATTQDVFHHLDGSTSTVATMHQVIDTAYAAGDGWQAVELSYAGGQLAMTLVVPAAGRFDTVDQALTDTQWQTVIGQLNLAQVTLSLPKFTTTTTLDLSADLSALGMPDAFSATACDLSGIDGRRDLLISGVLHKAFVKVDEAGTEAAAATAVVVGGTSAPGQQVTLRIDRPFTFLIRDVPTGAVLFVGRIVAP